MTTTMTAAPTATSVNLDRGWTVAAYNPDLPELDGLPPELDGLEWLEATVPGAVQYDLIRAGTISNPLSSGKASEDAAWVAATDWIYRVDFDLDPEIGEQQLAIELDGVDTFADVWLNDTLIGATANNYRWYRFTIPGGLTHTGVNTLVVHVKAHRRMIAPEIAEATARIALDGSENHNGKSVLRRYQRSFYGKNSNMLNMGTEVLGIGINRAVRIVVVAPVEIEDLFFEVLNASSDKADVAVHFRLRSEPESTDGLRVSVRLVEPDNDAIIAKAEAAARDVNSVNFSVPRPALWWPRGYGEPHLYRLVVDVLNGDDSVGTSEMSVGIKKVEIVRRKDNGRATFRIVVNDTEIYVRGYNVVPLDYIKVHGDWAEYRRIFDIICHGHGNLVRLWGGGAIENDAFYEECDRRGIMLWQDFYMHSALYPDYDLAWVEEFRQESTELVKRLRSHACLSVLCGGNEQIEGWEEWGWQGQVDQFYGRSLFDEVLPAVSRELCPSVPYVVNTPHGEGGMANSPTAGVIHSGNNFYNATKDPVFLTETCWNYQSYSRPETLKGSMGLDVADFAGLGWPARWREITELGLITKFPFTGRPEWHSLEDYLYGLEVEHMEADHQALSLLRTRSSSCTGIVYWPLNKGAPLFEFGCVDYDGRPLMNFYVVRRLFADVALGLYRDVDDVRVVASNVSAHSIEASLRLVSATSDGKVQALLEQDVSVPSWRDCTARGPARVLPTGGRSDQGVDPRRTGCGRRCARGRKPVFLPDI